MNTKTESHWTDDDLRRRHDDEMPADERAALTADLFTDPSLRVRLDRLAAIDEIGRRALCQDKPTAAAGRQRRTASRNAVWGGIAAVIGLTFVGVVWRAVATKPPPAPIVATAPDQLIEPTPEPTSKPASVLTYSQQRLILTFPVPAGSRAPVKRAPIAHRASEKTTSPVNDPNSVDTKIDSALARGHAAEALGLLAQSNVADRSDQWSRLGEMMQSAQRARAALLFLPVDQQIEIVRVWSAEPSLRPVVFERLGELIRDPATAASAKTLRAQLAENPQLRSWVTSYASAR